MGDVRNLNDANPTNASYFTNHLQSSNSYSSSLEGDEFETLPNKHYTLNIPKYIENDMTSMYSKQLTRSEMLSSSRFNDGPNEICNDELNEDLMNRALEDISSGSNEFPILDNISLEGLDLDFEGFKPFYPVEVQAVLTKPYYLLEGIACACSSMIIYCNIFMFAIISSRYPSSATDIFMRYVLSKAINFGGLGVVSYIFSGPSTYKSISCTIKLLITNAIVYEYKFNILAKYILIHFVITIIVALLAIGMFHDLIEDIDTKVLLGNVFSSGRPYKFSISYLLVACLMHFAAAIGITILTNITTSVNARTRVLNKFLLLFLLSISFGAVIGPIGYVWPSLALYSMLVLTRGAFDLFNMNLFITYATTILIIIFLYPLVALQIKFVWRKKYIRYIEY